MKFVRIIAMALAGQLLFNQSLAWAQAGSESATEAATSSAAPAAAGACHGGGAWEGCHGGGQWAGGGSGNWAANQAACTGAATAAMTGATAACAGGGGWAQAAQSGGINLNLTSTQATMMAPMYMAAPVNVNLAGMMKQITPGSAVTPAEMVALHQVMRTGTQSLVLDSFGAAQSGTFNLGGRMSQMISNLTVPQGVTVLVNAARTGSVNLTGNLSNSGSFYLYSTNPNVTTAALSAQNILNNQSGILSTVLPSGLMGSLNPAVSNLSLSLSAMNNIVNAGVISSAGNLSLYAGGSITNALPAGATGPNPLIQAMQSLTLTSLAGSITNSGLMAATTGNINIMAAQTANLTMNSMNGVLQATNGAINFRDQAYVGAAHTLVTGGNYLSKELNLYGGKGTVDVNIGNVSGVVNAWASCLHLAAVTPVLQMGVINATGDPYVVASNNLDLSSTTYSPYLVAIAGENIFTSSPSTSLTTGGGNLVLIAGANPIGSGTVTVNRSGLGGDVYLTSGGNFGGTPSEDIVALNTSNSSSNAGNVTLVAFADSSTSQTVGGRVFLPTSVQITTDGSNSGRNGNLTIVAEANSGNAISIGNFNSQSSTFGTGGGGTVRLAAATPNSGISGPAIDVANGNITGSFDSGLPANVQNGAIVVGDVVTGGAYYDPTHIVGSISVSSGGDVTVGTLNAVGASANGGGSDSSGQNGFSGANIFISAGGVVSTGSLLSFGGGGGGGGGARSFGALIGGAGGSGGDGGSIAVITTSSAPASILVTGDVNSSGGGGGGGGGGGAGGGALRPTGPGGSGGLGGQAGEILLTVPSTISVSGYVYAVGGGNGGAGGAAFNAGSFDNVGGGGGGGGGSYGGSGGGGGGGVGYVARVALPSASGSGGATGSGYSSGGWGGNGNWNFIGGIDSGGTGGSGGGFAQTFTNVGIGAGGGGGHSGGLFNVPAQSGFDAGALGNSGAASNSIAFASAGVTVGGVINATAATVTFIANGVTQIDLGALGFTPGRLTITDALLDQITAGQIVIGSLTSSVNILVKGTFSTNIPLELLGGPTRSILNLGGVIITDSLTMTSGAIGDRNQLLNLQVGHLTANATGTGVWVSNVGDVNIADSSVPFGGDFKLVNNGSIHLQGNISAPGGTIVLSANSNGSFTQDAGKVLTSPSISLHADQDLGTSSERIFVRSGVSAGTLSLEASAGESLFITDSLADDFVGINGLSAGGPDLVLTTNGSVDLVGALDGGTGINSGGKVALIVGSHNGAINVNNGITSAQSLTLTTNGTGELYVDGALYAQSGDIVLTAANILASASIQAVSGNVSLIPTSNADIFVNGTAITPLGFFYVTGGGSGLLDQISANTVVIGAPNLTGDTYLENQLNLGSGGYAFNVEFRNGGAFYANNNAIVATDKNIVIAGSNSISLGSVQANNGVVILVSGRDITFTDIDTSSSTSNGGAVIVVAGALFSQNDSIISVMGQSGFGGSITQNTGGTMVNSFSTLPGGSGGTIKLIAYASSPGATDGTGTVLLQPGSSMQSYGTDGASGAVVLIANGGTGANPAISFDSLTTAGGSAGSGEITISTSTAQGSVSDPIDITISNGTVNGDFFAGPTNPQDGSLVANGITGNSESSVGIFIGNTTQINSLSMDGGINQIGGTAIVRSGTATGVLPQDFTIGSSTANGIGTLSLLPGSGSSTYGNLDLTTNGSIKLAQPIVGESVSLKTTVALGLASGSITDPGSGSGASPFLTANAITLITLGEPPIDNSIRLTISSNGASEIHLIAGSDNGDVLIRSNSDVSIVDSSGAGSNKTFALNAYSSSIAINHDIRATGPSGTINLVVFNSGNITRPNGLGTLFANTVNLTAPDFIGDFNNPVDYRASNITYSATSGIHLITLGEVLIPVVSLGPTGSFSYRINPDVNGDGSILILNNGSNPTVSASSIYFEVHAGGGAGGISQQASSSIVSLSSPNISLSTDGSSDGVNVTIGNKIDNTGVNLSYSGGGVNSVITAVGSVFVQSLGGGGGSLNLTVVPDVNGNANLVLNSGGVGMSGADITLETTGLLSTITAGTIVTSSSSGGGDLTLITKAGGITVGDIFSDNYNITNSGQSGGNVVISTGTASINGGNIVVGNIKASSNTGPISPNTRGQGGNVTITATGATASGFVQTGTLATEGDRGGGDVTITSKFGSVSTQAITTYNQFRNLGIGNVSSPNGGNVTISAATTIYVDGQINTNADALYNGVSIATSRSNASGGNVVLTSFGTTAGTGAITVNGDIITYGDFGAGSVNITSTAGDIVVGNIFAQNIDFAFAFVIVPVFTVGSVNIMSGTSQLPGGNISVGSINTSSLQFRPGAGNIAGDVTLSTNGNNVAAGIVVAGDINTMGQLLSGNTNISTFAGNIVHSSGTIMTSGLTLGTTTGNIGSDPGASGRAVTTQASTLQVSTNGNAYIDQTGDLTVNASVIGLNTVFKLTSTGGIYLNGFVGTSSQSIGNSGQTISFTAGTDILNTVTNFGQLTFAAANLDLQAPGGTVGLVTDPIYVLDGSSVTATNPNFIAFVTLPIPPTPGVTTDATEMLNSSLLNSDSSNTLSNSTQALLDAQTTTNVNLNTASSKGVEEELATNNDTNVELTSQTSFGGSSNTPVDSQALGQSVADCGYDNFNSATISEMQSHGASIGANSMSNLCVLNQGNFLFQPNTDITVQVQEGDVMIPAGASAVVMETGHDVAVFDIRDGGKAPVRVRVGKKIITMRPGKQVVLTRQLSADFDQINPSRLIGYRSAKSELATNDIRAYSADFSLPSALMNVAPLKRMLTSDNPAQRRLAHAVLKDAVVLAEMTPPDAPFKTSSNQTK